MKKIAVLFILMSATCVWGQSSSSQEDKQWRQEMTIRNGFPAQPQYPTSPWLYRPSVTESVSGRLIYPESVIRTTRPGLSKAELEAELKKEQAELIAMRQPDAEDLQKYGNFLRQKKTGIFRMFPDPECDFGPTVDANDICASLIIFSKSFSFSERYYEAGNLYDIRFKDEKIILDGFLAQSIVSAVGDIPLENVTLQTAGMRFLTDFKPETKAKNAKIQFAQIAKTINADGFVYGKTVKLYENMTFLARVIGYRASNSNIQEDNRKIRTKAESSLISVNYRSRRDKVVAFRVIRKHSDGSISILWKELSDKKAPIIKFEKDELITDLKEQ